MKRRARRAIRAGDIDDFLPKAHGPGFGQLPTGKDCCRPQQVVGDGSGDEPGGVGLKSARGHVR